MREARSLIALGALLVALGAAAGASASGVEVNGVIQTQPVNPGDWMNPPFTGTVDINVHAPAAPNPNTGLLVVLHGMGGDYHSLDTACETWVNDLNVYTVQVNYRGTGQPPPGSIWDLGKSQAIDVLRAVKYMLDTYTIDKRRLFLWGASAGGNVALQTLKMAPRTFAMVAALSAITRPTTQDDRLHRGYENDPTNGWEDYCLRGRRYTTEEWDIRDAQYLASFFKGTPIYLLHGDADPIVDYQHSVDLQAALQAAGATSTFITIVGGGHGFGGAQDPTENTWFKATQKYLKAFFNSLTTSGSIDFDLQTKMTFPTRGTAAWPVKFDGQGLATLQSIATPGAVVNLQMTSRTVKQGQSLAFGLTIANWAGVAQTDTLLAGFYHLATATPMPLVGPVPFLLPAGGAGGPVTLPITTAFPTGEYLFVAIVLGAAPSAFIDLDFFQFTVTP